jgi:hypothetical protein
MCFFSAACPRLSRIQVWQEESIQWVAPENASTDSVGACRASYEAPLRTPLATRRGDRACPERAVTRQPANGRLRSAVGAGQVGLQRTLREPLHGLPALSGVSFWGRPNFTPLAFARVRPSPILARTSSPDIALLVLPDPATVVNRERIVALAAQHRIPAVYPFRFRTPCRANV